MLHFAFVGSSVLDEIDESLVPNGELSGFIELLGEDVEANSNFSERDRVIILPFPGQTLR